MPAVMIASIFINCPTPSQEKQPHTMILLPPCFATRSRCFQSKCSTFVRPQNSFPELHGFIRILLGKFESLFLIYLINQRTLTPLRKHLLPLPPAPCALFDKKWIVAVIHEDFLQLSTDFFSSFHQVVLRVLPLPHRSAIVLVFKNFL